MNEPPLTIRPMEINDLPAVVALERESGLSSWGIAGYERELLNPQAVLLVAVCSKTVVGYFSGRVMADEFELFAIAVRSGLRRQGRGRKLLEAGLRELQRRAIQTCFLEVRAANLAAQNFYLASGFKPLGVRRNYYHDPTDDAVTMVWKAIVPNARPE